VAGSIAIAIAPTCTWAQENDFEIDAGRFDRANAPTVFEVPTALRKAEQLQLAGDGKVMPVQWLRREKGIAAFVLDGKLSAGGKLNLKLTAATSASSSAPDGNFVVAKKTDHDRFLSLFLKGKEILRYPLVIQQPPSNIEALFAHNGHIHPLFTPAGKIVTAEFPADHAHQHGIFNAWVNTTFEGRKLDFWNQKAQTAKVEHVRVIDSQSGPVFGEFTVEMVHSDLIAPGGTKPVLKDVWTVRAWNVGGEFLVDIESRQTCIANSPLIVEQYHYGGMSFRGREDWLGVTASKFLTNEGKTRANGNHSRPSWVGIEGLVDGNPCSVTIMGYPDNFRHPEPVRLHPDKPYFVFTPVQLGKFELQPGVEHLARYRYLIADSPINATRADARWQELSEPIKCLSK
jgi:hypothetical protein